LLNDMDKARPGGVLKYKKRGQAPRDEQQDADSAEE